MYCLTQSIHSCWCVASDFLGQHNPFSTRVKDGISALEFSGFSILCEHPYCSVTCCCLGSLWRRQIQRVLWHDLFPGAPTGLLCVEGSYRLSVNQESWVIPWSHLEWNQIPNFVNPAATNSFFLSLYISRNQYCFFPNLRISKIWFCDSTESMYVMHQDKADSLLDSHECL